MLVEWDTHALPILRALSAPEDQGVRDGYFELGQDQDGGRRLGVELSDPEIHDALLALHDVGFLAIDNIEYAGGGFASVIGARVTGAGLQALGQWPSVRGAMTPVTLVAILERLKDYAADCDAKVEIDKAVGSAKRTSSETLKSAVTAFASEALRNKLGLR